MTERLVPQQRPGAPFRVLEMTRIPVGLANKTPFRPRPGWWRICAKVAEQAGITISREQEAELWRIVRHYCRDAYREVQRPTASAARHEIEAIARRSFQLGALLSKLNADNRISVRSLIAVHFPEDQADRFDGLDEAVVALNAACAAVLEDFDEHVQGKPGNPGHIGFGKFVDRLEAFFKNSGHYVAANYSETYPPEARRWTPFVRFCWSIYEHVPPIPGVPPIASKSAFGEAVKGALEKGE